MQKELEQILSRNIVVGINHSTGAYDVTAVDWQKLISELEQLFSKTHVSGSLPSNQQFNSIPSALLPHYFLRYPNKEGLTSACLHFLGDDAQKWYDARRQ